MSVLFYYVEDIKYVYYKIALGLVICAPKTIVKYLRAGDIYQVPGARGSATMIDFALPLPNEISSRSLTVHSNKVYKGCNK